MADTGTVVNGTQYYGATININGYLAVGTGTLSIGGTVSNSAEGYIGWGSPSDGTVNVNSASGVWNVGTDLYVGYDMAGVLLLALGGTVNVNGGTGTVYIGYNAGATGTLNIGAASGSTAAAAGTLNAATIAFGAGTGTLYLNHTSTGYVLGAALTGAGTLTQAAGVTQFTGDGTGFTGTASVTGGTLLVDSTLAGDVDVASGGTLGGSGSIGGAVTVANGGAISQTQGSTLTMGSLALGDTSGVNVTLGLPDTSDPALFDVTGDLVLDGLLSVTNAGTFDYGSYKLFTYGGTLTNSGLTISALPAGFNPGDWTIADAASTISLVVASGSGRQYWDGSFTVANSVIDGGSGTWSAAGTNWTNSAGNINAPWASERAVFGGASGGTVTVEGTQTVSGLVFDATGDTTTYQLASGTGAGLAIASMTDMSITVNAAAAGVGVAISGDAGLVKLGAGALTLSAANGYTGLTTVQTGSLLLSGSGTVAASSGVDVISGATFDVSGITPASATVQALSGAGTLALGGKSLTFGTSASTSFSGAVTGTGSLTKQGSGTLTFTGSTANLSAFNITAGTVATSGGDAIGNSTQVNLSSGATLAVTGSESMGALNGTGGAVTVASGTLTTSSSTNTTFGGTITGSGYVVKTGTGTLTLSGANAWGVGAASGTTTTTITQGTVAVDGGSISHSNGSMVVGNTSGMTGSLQVSHGTVSDRNGLVANAAGSTGTVTVGEGGVWNNASDLRLGAAGTGAGTLTVQGGGDVTSMTGYVAYSSGSTGTALVTGAGSTWVTSGRLTVGNFTSGSGTASLTVRDGGQVQADTEDLQAYGLVIGHNASVNIGANAVSAAAAAGELDVTRIQVRNNTSTLNFNHTSSNYEQASEIYIAAAGSINAYAGNTLLSGEISAAFAGTGSIHVYGGTLDLAGDNNSFTGTTYLHGGTLKVSHSNALGFGMNGPGALMVQGAGTLQVGAGLALDNAISLGAALTMEVASGTATLNGALSGSYGITKTGAGVLALTGSNTYTGATIQAGTLQGSTAAIKGDTALTATGGQTATLAFSQVGNGSYTGAIAGYGTVRWLGTGELTLSGISSYIGTTEIGTGTLVLGNASAAGISEIAFSSTGASTLRIQNFSLGNTLTHFGTDDAIDLQGLTFANGEVSTSYDNGTLTVHQGATTFTLAFDAIDADSAFVTRADSDGSTLLTILSINDSPVLDLDNVAAGTGAAAAYTEQATAVAVAPAATVGDEDSADFAGGSLTVDFTANGSADDVLAVRNDGTGAGQVGVSGADVTYGGLTIGTFTGGTAGAPLVISFTTADASAEAVQALVRAITFANGSDTPATATRSIGFTLVDGDGTAGGGADTATATATLTLTASNDAATGGVTVTGTATQGEVLTGDASAVADADGLGTLTYQWLRGGAAIDGANASTYTLAEADVGQQISLRVSFVDGYGTSESVTSSATAAVLNVNDPATGAVTITGTAAKGQMLTADTSALDDADGMGSMSYQWLRDGAEILDATDGTYTLTLADVDAQISVRVSYMDGHGTPEEVTSGLTATVVNVNTAATGSVALSGTATQGQLLTADTGAIADADGLGAFSYEWLRDGTPIGGAAASTYTLTEADVNAQISVRVSFVDGGGFSESITSAATAAVANVNDNPTGSVTVSGTATEDQLLTADASGLGDADGLGSFSWQWLRDNVAIEGALSSTYQLTQADVGHLISARVTYTDGHGAVENKTSAQTSAVANVNDTPTGGVSVTGAATLGQWLNANTGALADEDGLGAFSYQWLRDGAEIGAANGASYLLTSADLGAAISVRVSYVDQQGTAEFVVSGATAPVTSGGQILTGGTGNDVLIGAGGNDVLNGSTGADTMNGGVGDDTYFIDNPGDTVIDAYGRDTIVTTIEMRLPTDIETLVLGGTANLSATGNNQQNTLVGNIGDNRMDGGGAADRMLGGAGNDTYMVENIGDQVVEEPGEGTDTVWSSISWTLSDNVENLVLTGQASTGNGNVLDNAITGNGTSNTLWGGLGADTLTGGAGRDTFVYTGAAESTAAAWDRIMDFNGDDSDRLDLRGVDADAGRADVQRFTFIGNAAFGGNATGQLRFDAGSHMLLGSTDADADAEFAIELVGLTVFEAGWLRV